MKNLLITLSIAAAVTVGSAFGPVHAADLTTVSVISGNGSLVPESCTEKIVLTDSRDGIARLKSLFESCRLQLHYVYKSVCVKDPSEDSILPDCPATESPAPEEPQPTPPVSDNTTPETEPEENEAPDSEKPENTQPVPPASETTKPETDPETDPETKPGDTATQEPESPAPDDTADVPETLHPYILRIVELVNEERAKAGLNPLTLDSAASSAALIRAREIVGFFSHTRPDGSSFATALKEQGIRYRQAGENIAWGQRSPEQVMEGWMNSPGHRANILGESFTHIGVGYYQENGVNYWTQLFF